MNRKYSLVMALAVAAGAAGCASTPKTMEELETARAIVPQVEASPASR
jgi:hypothetical protein